MKFIKRFSRKAAVQQPVVASAAAPLLMALEPRIMFDASVGVVAEAAAEQTAADTSSDDTAANTPAAAAADTRTPQNGPRQEVVFVDGGVANVGELLEGVSGNAEVVILDPSKDGLQQMADYLKGREGLDAIHLLSHGADGSVQMGNVWLSSGNLGEHRAALESIGAALNADGDLMLYGCDVGQGDKGQVFLDQLAEITGADVAASVDDTGAAALGGNWVLERSSGSIETSALSISDYDSLMAASYSGGIVASAPTLGATGNLMKYVVGDFNGDGRADILYQAAGNGGAWSLAQSNSDGTFTIFSQANSIFAGLPLGDASTGGANFHAADFNGDGRIDLLAAPLSGPTMKLYLNTGNGFTSQDVTGPSFGVRTLVGDFDGDGDLDILYQTNGSASSWAMARNNGGAAPTFTTLTSADGTWPFGGITMPDYNAYNYKAADVDGDGYTDLIYVASGTQMKYFRNNNGAFVDLTSSAGLPITAVSRAIVADFDGDGDADILYQTNGNGSAFRYVRNDNGTFVDVDQASSPFAGVALPDIASQQFRVGDFDGDGDLDLISTSSTTNSTSIFYQSGSLPRLVSSTPADNSLTVAPGANIVLTFDQSVSKGTGNIYIVRTSDNTPIQTIDVTSGRVTGSGTTWTIDPPADMFAGESYAVRIDNKTFANANGQVYMGIQNNTALNFTVASVAAPVIANLGGDSVTYTEKGSAVLIDQSNNAVVTDADSANFNGGNVRVAVTGGAVTSEDVLSILSLGTGAGQISVSGSNVLYGGVTIGAVTGGIGGSALVITLNASADASAVSALVRSLQYSNSNTTTPNVAQRTLSVTVTDETGTTSTASVVTVNIQAVNDAPVVNTTGTNPTFTENGSAVQVFSGTTINTVETGQTVTQMTFSVSNLANGASEMLMIDGSGVALVADTSLTTLNNGLTVSVSVSSGTATVTVTHVGLSSATAQAIVNNIAYRNDNDVPTGTSRTVTLTNVRDSGGTSNSGQDTTSPNVTSVVTLVAVNDAPIVTGSGGSVGWTEGNNVTSTPVAVDSGIVISDPDGPSIASATVTLGGTYVLGEDTLGFTPNPATMGNITSSWDAVNGIMTLTSAGGATQAQFQAALRSITYTNDSDTPTTTTRTVTFQVNDGSLDSNLVTRNVTITAVNDAPVISAPTNVTVTEDTLSPVTGIILSDVDSASGTLTLTVGAGNLSGTSGSGVTVGGTGTALTLTGTLTAINNYIAAGSLKYTPALNSNTSVTLGLSLDTSSVGTDTRNLTLDITPVNDAPTISGPVSINVTEDVPRSMAGITFGDVDAGTNSVRVIFSVANGNGTFSATASSGVTVTNNGTNAITLEGTVADINTLVSNGRLTYLGALNGTGVKTMSISINDNGNTGSGGPLQVNANISLVIAAVNDAPVNNLPAAQTVFQDGSLVFNSANGNLITITDVDAGGNTVKLSLTSVNGQMTLGSIVGLSFSTGDGTNDTAMVFTGTLAAINAALNGLTFTPLAGYNGTGSITFESDDQGYSGSGGVKTDVDVLAITIAPINPKITGVVAASGSDGPHKVGDTIGIVVQFDNAVIVDSTSGIPTLLLETGAIDRQAVYLSGTGTNQLVFSYTVQAGDLSADLDYASTSALSLNGAVMQSAQGYAAILTLPTVGGASSLAGQQAIVVDGVAPSISNILLPADASYRLGQNLDFTVNFSEAVSVDATGGTPRIEVTLDTGGVAYAEYVSGSGSSALVFRLVVASGQQDSNGITVGNSIQLNGGSLRDLAGNDSAIALTPGNSSGILVDGIVPTVASVDLPANGSYKAGDVLSFTLNTSEAVLVDTLGGTPRLVLDVGGVTRYANYVSGAADGSLVFQYTVQSGDTASGGITVNGTLDLNGGHVNDPAGNALNLNLGAVGNTGNVLVDTTTPYATNITRVDATPNNSSSVSYTVTFSEDVGNVDVSDFNLIFGGSVAGSIESVTAVDGKTFTVKVGGLSGTGTVRLDLRPGTDIADAAGNKVPGGRVGVNYSIDRDAPSVTSVGVPGNGTYVAGQDLDFTVRLSENVQLNTSNGTPRIEVTLDNGQKAYANYLSGSGSNALVFRLSVANGQLDSDGITLGSAIDLNGATLRDAIGNDAVTTLNSVGDTSGVTVDAVVPVVNSVDLPANGSYKAGDVLSFTLNTSEGVVVDTLGGTPRLVLTVGGVTRYASYVSGAADGALVFQYTVQNGDTASGGIVVNGTLDLNGGHVNDPAGNALNLNLGAVGNTGNVLVDTTTPYATNITRVDATPNNSGSVSYTVTFSENVGNVDVSDFNLIFGGSVAGSIESVTAVDGKTFTVKVGGLTGTGTVRLDLRPGTDIADAAGNQVPGGRVGVNYSIDRDAPSVTSVGVPSGGSYVAGQNLDFTVNLDEVVQVNTSNGTPRIEVTLDDGQKVYANYLSGSGSNALVFRLEVASGMAGNGTFTVAQGIDLNGGGLRDAVGNDADTALKNVGDTSGILVDARAPQPISIVSDGTAQPGDRSLSFTLTFDEAVSGVDVSDFSLMGTQSASGTIRSVQQIDAQTYRVVIDGITGQGSLSLGLNAQGSGIQDAAGNLMTESLSGPAESIRPQDVGDLEYRINPPSNGAGAQGTLLQPQVPGIVVSEATSPLAPGSLFEVRTVGGDIQPLGTIFLGNAGSAPSFIAQVFGSSDNGIGGGQSGFLGFGGGSSDVFGSSTFATIFSHEVPGVSELSVFSGSQWKQSDLNLGPRGVFGVPTFGQQLQQFNEADQRQVRELAMALAQSAQIGQRT